MLVFPEERGFGSTKGLAINWREVGSFGFLFVIQLRLRREVINLALVKSINFKLII